MTYSFIILTTNSKGVEIEPVITINIAAPTYNVALKQLPNYIINYKHD